MDKGTFASAEEIQYIASLLIPDENFEPEKIAIIKCNESKDIKACPGSGKTTTLLAKLAILANRMPLEDNKGICVLTHTNVAINEIKDKIGIKADILFKYPNHFGTIQSFVDKFLAIPEYIDRWNKKLRRIDNDFSCKKLEYKFKRIPFEEKKCLYSQIKDRLPKPENIPYGQKTKMVNELELNFIQNIYVEFLSEYDYVFKRNYSDNRIFAKTKGTPTFDLLSELRYSHFDDGIIFFNDAYSLAFSYLLRRSVIKNAFIKRFKYVFIDEMQDTDLHQIDLIKKLFDEKKIVVQCFGDPYQSIYNLVKTEEVWKPVDPLIISSSKRFGEKIAKILRAVCIIDNSGLTPNENIKSIDPILIVFENPKDVLPKFCEIITYQKIKDRTIWEISECENLDIKAIGWVGEPNDEDRADDRLTIQSYFGNFKKELRKKEKVNYDSLKSFLRKRHNANLKDYSDSIIDALLQILSMENIKNMKANVKRDYTKTTLLEELKENHRDIYDKLLQNIAIWSKEIHSSYSYDEKVINEIKKFIQHSFLLVFNIQNLNSDVLSFVKSEPQQIFTEQELKANNTYEWENDKRIKIQLGTIHSVKGETHAATLYLETWYQGKHESEWIMPQLLGKPYIDDGKVRVKECLKMAYVGMSRPRYLLCMAIHKNRYNSKLDIENGGSWKIINI